MQLVNRLTLNYAVRKYTFAGCQITIHCWNTNYRSWCQIIEVDVKLPFTARWHWMFLTARLGQLHESPTWKPVHQNFSPYSGDTLTDPPYQSPFIFALCVSLPFTYYNITSNWWTINQFVAEHLWTQITTYQLCDRSSFCNCSWP